MAIGDQMLSSLESFFDRVDAAMEPLLDATIDTTKCLNRGGWLPRPPMHGVPDGNESLATAPRS